MQPANQYKRGKPDLDGQDGPFGQKKNNGPAVSRRAVACSVQLEVKYTFTLPMPLAALS